MYKICVIEDETIIRKGLIASIDWKKYNCKVVGEAANGLEGIKIIESSKPDIIVLDINMPIMDGLEMLALLPANTYSFIIVSGHSEFEYAKKAIKFDVSEYLLKPVDHKLFETALVRAIEDFEMKIIFTNSSNSASINHQFHVIDTNIQVDSFTLTNVLNYISENYSKKITMNDLEVNVGKSSTSIANRFQSYLNTNFSEYLTNFRIQKSIDLIKELKFHLYEVGEMVGYNDYKYFSQVFRKVVGVPPKIVETYYLRHSKNSAD